MSDEELDELAEHVQIGPYEADGDQAAEPGAADPPAGDEQAAMVEPNAGLVEICKMAVAVIGGVITARAEVEPLSDDEVGAVAGAGARVAAQYDLTLSPRSAAWIGLGMAVVAVTAPRLREVQARQAAEGETVDDAPGDVVDVTPAVPAPGQAAADVMMAGQNPPSTTI